MAVLSTQQIADHRYWLQWVARAGYAARGAVYILVGVLALLAAIRSAPAEGSKGALAALLGEPGGTLLLAIIGLGLIGHALWRFFQAVFDADRHGSDGKGLATRAGFVVSSIVHLLLGIYSLGIIFGWATTGENDDAEKWTTWLMSKPFGAWLVALVGVVVAIFAISQFVRARRETFKKYMELSPDQWAWASPVSKAGLSARGVVFVIIGAMLVVAAYRADPGQAVGVDGALTKLQQTTYGAWLLGIIALGLIAFSIYSFLLARYRRILIPELPPRR